MIINSINQSPIDTWVLSEQEIREKLFDTSVKYKKEFNYDSLLCELSVETDTDEIDRIESMLKRIEHSIDYVYNKRVPLESMINKCPVDTWFICVEEILESLQQTRLIFKDGFDYDGIRRELREAKLNKDLSQVDYLENKLHRIEQSIIYEKP